MEPSLLQPPADHVSTDRAGADHAGADHAGADHVIEVTGLHRRYGPAGAAGFDAVRGVDLAGIIRTVRAGGSPLTPRETDVLELAADSTSVAGIAERAALSQGTVRNYLSAAAAKLGAENRHAAVRIAREHGWI